MRRLHKPRVTLLRDARIVKLALAVHRRFGNDDGSYLSVGITYYAFLSLFPLLLLVLSAIGFVLAGDEAAVERWAGRLAGAIPGLGPLIGKNLRAIVEGRAGAGLIGLAGLLWTGTGAVEAAGHALTRVFGVPGRAGFVRTKMWSIARTLGLGLLGLAGGAIAGAAGGSQRSIVMRAFGIVVAFALDVTLFLVAYRVLVQRRRPAFRDLWPGALLAAVGWTTLKAVGAWYAARTVASSTAVYGTFGSVVGVLALLSISARLFVYGAELNAVLIDERSEERRPLHETGRKDPAAPAMLP